MSRAPKSARMSVGGCHPPHYVYEPMKQDEELSVYQDKQVVYPVELPSPMPSPTPEPEEEEEIEPMEEIPQEIIDVSSDEEQDVDQGDGQPPSLSQDGSSGSVPPPSMGWTERILQDPECNVHTHQRLVALLTNHYADWNASVHYTCSRFTHPLENTYWKTVVTISAWNEELKASEVEIAHRHMGRRATMEHSIEDAAYHAWVTLRGNRFDAIRQGHDRHLPRADKDLEDGWGMLEPLGLDSTARGAVYFAYDMVKKSQNLEDTVRQQGRDLKRLQKESDDLRERLGEPRIYDLLCSLLRP